MQNCVAPSSGLSRRSCRRTREPIPPWVSRFRRIPVSPARSKLIALGQSLALSGQRKNWLGVGPGLELSPLRLGPSHHWRRRAAELERAIAAGEPDGCRILPGTQAARRQSPWLHRCDPARSGSRPGAREFQAMLKSSGTSPNDFRTSSPNGARSGPRRTKATAPTFASLLDIA
jgi:hypothetical protein